MNQTEMPYQKNSVSLSRNNPKVYIEVDIMLKVELRLPTRQDKTSSDYAHLGVEMNKQKSVTARTDMQQ